jgi:hypothetical protein
VFLGSTPIGSPIAGWVGQQFGAPIGLIGGGVIALALGAGVLWQLRRVRVASPAFDTSIAPGRAA